MQIRGTNFIDEQGRILHLRGVNLGGSSKLPYSPDGATYRSEKFFDHRDISFVGRPFPLDEADTHFTRLKNWGFNFLRLIITWEAIEHAGPGIYDTEYLDYVEKIARKAGEYGFSFFIDPHQDVWSRFTGGDGAPGWTLEAVGMDMQKFAKNEAAVVHSQVGGVLPKMIWPTNAAKLASSSMFTLFFAGNDFAPKIKIDGISIQEYLQEHYFQAVAQLAMRLKGMTHIAGYDTLNEPSAGYIGVDDLNQFHLRTRWGQCPTAFQSMVLGDGNSVLVEKWKLGLTGMRFNGKQQLNKERERAWQEGRDCIWRQHGVWDYDNSGEPILLCPDYFSKRAGKDVNFAQDYLRPFIERYTEVIRSVHENAFIFIESDPHGKMPFWQENQPANLVNATHWYDNVTLVLKNHFPFFTLNIETEKPVFGRRNVIRTFTKQIAKIKQESTEKLGGIPTVVGEFGIPFDLQNKKAYKTGNFTIQTIALDASYSALENNLMHSTLWNYTADNTNEHGDQWNDEDLSIFSEDQRDNPVDINSGGRALHAFVRPYAISIAGKPKKMMYDINKGKFIFEFIDDLNIKAPTEIFLPKIQFPDGFHAILSDGSLVQSGQDQIFLYQPDSRDSFHRIVVHRVRNKGSRKSV